jgi:hypothetical protein
MATKKAKAKGVPKQNKPPKLPDLEGLKCNVPNICKFLEDLSKWLKWFHGDYTKLRIAVCNVEKEAFASSGINAKPPKFCSGGPGNEPAPPPPPPVW